MVAVRILLIYPYCLDARLKDYDVRPVPLGLYYVGAVLREQGHDVDILNWYEIEGSPERINEVLSKERPDIVGLSVLQANRFGAVEVARAAKRINPGVTVVCGGVGATFLWAFLLKNFPEIDYVVRGEGELAFSRLVRAVQEGAVEEIRNIPGIAFRTPEGPVDNACGEFIEDLDTLPNPARYFTFQHVASSRGCPWTCTFCGSPQFWNGVVRFHSPGYFVDQLELLYRRGVRFFYVSDDTFTMKKGRVIEICKEILQRGLEISWAAISRVNCVSEEVLYWMRKAGCIQISYGVESGSEKIRDFFNKNILTRDIKAAFAMTTRCGILPRAYFIYGAKGESRETIQESIDLMHEIRPLSAIFYILALFPGTALYADFERRFRPPEGFWLQRIEDIQYYETDPSLTPEDVLRYGERLRAEYYRNLPGYVDAIEVVDREDMSRLHADFFSRLGMTFSHGDYAHIEEIPGREEVAERLFTRALRYHPDERAYLGLGIINQKNGRYRESVRVLTEGVGHFAEAQPLRVCLALSLMNLGEFGEALKHLMRVGESRETLAHIAACHRALGDVEKALLLEKKLDSMRRG
jgi:anaerobic magnesium-protoporphyrin IX monomethyl ester cyclase